MELLEITAPKQIEAVLVEPVVAVYQPHLQHSTGGLELMAARDWLLVERREQVALQAALVATGQALELLRFVFRPPVVVVAQALRQLEAMEVSVEGMELEEEGEAHQLAQEPVALAAKVQMGLSL